MSSNADEDRDIELETTPGYSPGGSTHNQDRSKPALENSGSVNLQ